MRIEIQSCEPWEFEIAPGESVVGTFAYTIYDDGGMAVAVGPARSKEEAEEFAKEAMKVI